MKKIRIYASTLLLLLSSAVLTAGAKADSVTLSLTNPSVVGAPGSTLTITGTIFAPSTNRGDVYLNGDSISLAIAGAKIDDTPFLTNFPLSLSSGQSASGALFTLLLPARYDKGIYMGSFQLLGGGTDASTDVLGTASFQVEVTPEPGAVVLGATGLLFVAAVAFYRREPALPTA